TGVAIGPVAACGDCVADDAGLVLPGCGFCACCTCCTCCVTCRAQSTGFTLWVITASAVAPAAVTATTAPTAIFAVSAAPAPRRIGGVRRPGSGVRRPGSGMRHAGMVPPACRSSRRWRSSSRCLSKGRVSRVIEAERRPWRKYPISFHPVRQLDPQARLRGREPRCNRSLRDAECRADLAICVAVVVAQHQRRGLLGGNLAQRAAELRVLG